MQANIFPYSGWGKMVKLFFLLKDQMNRKVGHAHAMVIFTMVGLWREGEVFFNLVGTSVLHI